MEEDTVRGKIVLPCEEVTVHTGKLDSGGPLSLVSCAGQSHQVLATLQEFPDPS